MKLDSLKHQPSSDIMKAIVAANPNSKKLDALTNPKWPLDSMFTYADPKSVTPFSKVTPDNNDDIDPNARRYRDAEISSVTNTAVAPQPHTPTAPADGNLPQESQHPGATTYAPNQTVSAKTDDNQSNSIAALLNNNPGYLTPTAIGQTLIAALLGRLLGGKTGMGLGAIMGLLASPLTASWLAKNNYLSNIAKPFSETEKGWFNPNKSE